MSVEWALLICASICAGWMLCRAIRRGGAQRTAAMAMMGLSALLFMVAALEACFDGLRGVALAGAPPTAADGDAGLVLNVLSLASLLTYLGLAVVGGLAWSRRKQWGRRERLGPRMRGLPRVPGNRGGSRA